MQRWPQSLHKHHLFTTKKYMYQNIKKFRQHVVTGQFWETHSIQIKNLNIEWKFNQESQLLKATSFKILFCDKYIHTDSLNDYCLPCLSTFNFHSDWLAYTGKQWGWLKLHVNGLAYQLGKPSKNQREALYVNLFYYSFWNYLPTKLMYSFPITFQGSEFCS